MDVSKNLFRKQLVEFVDINLTSAIISYRENYKTTFLDMVKSPHTANLFDNNRTIYFLNFAYTSIF
jgi:hypothetical protein